MEPFEKDGMVVIQQVLNKFLRRPACNNIGFQPQVCSKTSVAAIILNRHTIFVQFCGGSPLIFKAVKVNADARMMQGPYFIKNINHPPVICGKRNVERNNMQLLDTQAT